MDASGYRLGQIKSKPDLLINRFDLTQSFISIICKGYSELEPIVEGLIRFVSFYLQILKHFILN